MSQDENSHIEIAYSSIRCFADDGTLDMQELNSLVSIALRDGVVTDDERRVLASVFRQVERRDVTDEVWDKIQDVRTKHSIY